MVGSKRMEARHVSCGIPTITLEPSLSHCVETVARRERDGVLGLLLSGEHKDRSLEQRFALLRLFLESVDFGELRSRCQEPLLAGRRVECRLGPSDAPPGFTVEIVAT
jgi:hypothetical protein